MSNTPPQHLSSTIMYWVWLTPVYMTSPPKSWFWKLILIWAHVLYTGLIWFAGCSLLWQTDCSIQLIKLALWCRASLLKVWKYSIKKIDRTLPCIKLLALFHPSAAHSWCKLWVRLSSVAFYQTPLLLLYSSRHSSWSLNLPEITGYVGNILVPLLRHWGIIHIVICISLGFSNKCWRSLKYHKCLPKRNKSG